MPATRAVVLLAHGSHDARWREPIEAVAQAVRRREPSVQAVCAYLEISSPTLPEAVTQLASQGVTSIRVFPLFLGVGKHLRDDLPRLFEEVCRTHPTMGLTMLPSAGESSQVIELLADLAVAHHN